MRKPIIDCWCHRARRHPGCSEWLDQSWSQRQLNSRWDVYRTRSKFPDSHGSGRCITILCLLKDSKQQFSTIFPRSNGFSCLWTEETSGSLKVGEGGNNEVFEYKTWEQWERWTFYFILLNIQASWNYVINASISWNIYQPTLSTK